MFLEMSFEMFPSGLILLTRCETTDFPEFLGVVKIPQAPIVFSTWRLEVLTPHNGRLARCQSCGVRKAVFSRCCLPHLHAHSIPRASTLLASPQCF